MVTDFERDRRRLEEALSAPAARSAGPGAVTRSVHLRLQRAVMTGRCEDYEAAERALASAFEAVGPFADLCLLQADLDVRFHRIAAARRTLGRATELFVCTRGRAILADVLLQEGEVDEAEALVVSLVNEERTWDHLARLAHVAACRGDLEHADTLYVEAEDEITAKAMRPFAWVEMERGRLRVLAGDFSGARSNYATAGRAYSGHWMLDERLGELCALEDQVPEAITLMEKVLERTGRPEASQTLAELYSRVGDTSRARFHRARAVATFLASAQAGEVHYLHHLVDITSGEAGDPGAAVEWARRDLAARPNHLTRSALAQALHRAGRTRDALKEMSAAVATGLRDPRLLSRAAVVFGSPDQACWPVEVPAPA